MIGMNNNMFVLRKAMMNLRLIYLDMALDFYVGNLYIVSPINCMANRHHCLQST